MNEYNYAADAPNIDIVEAKKFFSDNVRTIIKDIAIRAEQKMAICDKQKGDSWKTCEIEYLKWKLLTEVNEALNPYVSPQSQAMELADVVAVCAMLAARLKDESIENPELLEDTA